MRERGRSVVAGGRAVGIDDDDGEVGRPQAVEIHGQETDIEYRVPVPQSVVEFETVDDPRPVLHQVDIRRQQVPVTVHDPARVDPGPQQRTPAAEVVIGEHRDVVDDLAGIPPHLESAQVLERLGPQPVERVLQPRIVDLHRARALVMQLRDLPGHLAQAGHDVRIADPARAGLTLPHQSGETETFREPAHLHDVIDDVVVVTGVVGVPPTAAPHLQHPEVDVRGEATVELHLAAALLRAGRRGAVVEEPEVEWLADFVSLVTPEEDERAVRLHHDGRPPRPGPGRLGHVHGTQPRQARRAPLPVRQSAPNDHIRESLTEPALKK